jgi:hypothetical protein
MPTGTQAQQVTEYNTQQIHYLRKTFRPWHSGQTLIVGKLPLNSHVLPSISGVYVLAASNDSGTGVFDLGLETNVSFLLSSINVKSKGFTSLATFNSGAGYYMLSNTQRVIAGRYTGQNNNATLGIFTVILAYTILNSPYDEAVA